MPTSKALPDIPELGFLNPGILLSCPSLLSHQQAGDRSHSKLTDGKMQASCAMWKAVSQQQVHPTRCTVPIASSADFSPSMLFTGLSQGPTTPHHHIELAVSSRLRA